MNDFTDVFYVMVAMVIFSMLTVNTARSFISSSDTVIRSDVEYRAIIRAQDEIDQVKLIGREDEDRLNPNDADYIFENYPITVSETFGLSDEYSDTYEIDASSEYIDEGDIHVKRYLITVNLTNTYLDPEINVTLTYIKSFSR